MLKKLKDNDNKVEGKWQISKKCGIQVEEKWIIVERQK